MQYVKEGKLYEEEDVKKDYELEESSLSFQLWCEIEGYYPTQKPPQSKETWWDKVQVLVIGGLIIGGSILIWYSIIKGIIYLTLLYA